MVATDIGVKLERLREVIDMREQLSQTDKELSAEKSQIERELEDYSRESGLDTFKGGGMSISFNDALRAKYEPEKWPQIVRQLVADGNEHLIQRRLTDAKVEELALTSGLPEGLSLEPYRKISVRRI